MTLRISQHALDRLRERFEWAGTRAAAAAYLEMIPAVRAAVAMGGYANVTLPGLGMRLAVDAGLVVTAIPLDGPTGRRRRKPRPRKHPDERVRA